MSKEAIIDKILADASNKANSFVAQQQEKADAILAEAAAECRDYLYRSQSEAAQAANDVLARSKAVAELDAKKLLLKAKRELLDRVFTRALEKLVSLDAKKRKKLLTGMLQQAEDGDVITASINEKDIITPAVIEKFAKSKKISLSLNPEYGDFAGGLILSGGGVDKNLTYEMEIANLRDSLETEVAKQLFE